MNVLCDMHHSSLLNSLIMLFEGRLGGNLYRPIGTQWYAEGFWAINDHPATVQQYLTLDQGYRPADGTPPLNLLQEVNSPQFDDPEVYYCRDIDSDRVNKAITLETFKEMDIDIVIATLPQHVEPFKRLIRLYKPEAKLIYQIGNTWDPVDVDNVMASALVSLGNVPNSVIYHQEFDINIFKPSFFIKPNKSVVSFINVYPEFPQDYPQFLALEKLMPDHEFKSYGGQCRDGAINGSFKLAQTMQEAGFIWHKKSGADGYGHIVHNAFACGKLLLVNYGEYKDKLGGLLMEPGETCIDADAPVNEIKAAIEFYSEPARYKRMCENAYRKFRQVVDFEREFFHIEAFLERL